MPQRKIIKSYESKSLTRAVGPQQQDFISSYHKIKGHEIRAWVFNFFFFWSWRYAKARGLKGNFARVSYFSIGTRNCLVFVQAEGSWMRLALLKAHNSRGEKSKADHFMSQCYMVLHGIDCLIQKSRLWIWAWIIPRIIHKEQCAARSWKFYISRACAS